MTTEPKLIARWVAVAYNLRELIALDGRDGSAETTVAYYTADAALRAAETALDVALLASGMPESDLSVAAALLVQKEPGGAGYGADYTGG